MARTPRSSTELINQATEDNQRLQEMVEFWTRMHHIKFSASYHQALLASGIERSKADEIGEVMRQNIERISSSLDNAAYLLRELASEAADASHRATQNADSGFQAQR